MTQRLTKELTDLALITIISKRERLNFSLSMKTNKVMYNTKDTV